MPLVHIKSAELSPEQKRRIGERIIYAFHEEGMAAGSVVVLFEREVADIYLEGVLFPVAVGAPQGAAPVLAVAVVPPPPPPVVPEAGLSVDFKNKLRRSKPELLELKSQLVAKLQAKGVLSSFQAQLELGLKACDWAPATLRRFFSELEEEGVIAKQGQKRGTRYVWQGIAVTQAPAASVPKLVKRIEDELAF